MSKELLMKSLRESATAGNLNQEQVDHVLSALDSDEKVALLQSQVKAINWTSILSLISGLSVFFPQLAPLIAIAQTILSIINNLPVPTPTPVPMPPTPSPFPSPSPIPGGGGDIPDPVIQ